MDILLKPDIQSWLYPYISLENSIEALVPNIYVKISIENINLTLFLYPNLHTTYECQLCKLVLHTPLV